MLEASNEIGVKPAAATWSRARLSKALGLFGEEYEQLYCDQEIDSEQLVVQLADALRCVATRERALLVLKHTEVRLDLSEELVAYQRPDPLMVYPLTKSDVYLARLVRAKEGLLNKRATPVKQTAPNRFQLAYVAACNEMVIEKESGEAVSPVVNRTVWQKLGAVTDYTTEFDFSTHMLGGHGVIPLLRALQGHRHMRAINLSWNDIREVSLPHVERLVKTCKNLSSVDLSQNRYLSATAGRMLLHMVRRYKEQLRYVTIANCSIPHFYYRSIRTTLGQAESDEDEPDDDGGLDGGMAASDLPESSRPTRGLGGTTAGLLELSDDLYEGMHKAEAAAAGGGEGGATTTHQEKEREKESCNPTLA